VKGWSALIGAKPVKEVVPVKPVVSDSKKVLSGLRAATKTEFRK